MSDWNDLIDDDEYQNEYNIPQTIINELEFLLTKYQPGDELELRFRGIKASAFHELQQKLESECDGITKYLETYEELFENNVRVKTTNDNITIVEKMQKGCVFIPRLDIKVALSRENQLAKRPSTQPVLIREKRRHTYLIDNTKWDLTTVNSQNNSTYEVEVEIVHTDNSPFFNISEQFWENIDKCIEKLNMKPIPEKCFELIAYWNSIFSYDIKKISESRNINFKELLAKDLSFFNPQNKPRNLKHRDLHHLENCYMTPKADGLRHFMLFLAEEGVVNIYLILPPIEIVKIVSLTSPTTDQKCFHIFDAEVCDQHVYIFDTLFYNSKNVRGLEFEKRFNCVLDFEKSFLNTQVIDSTFELKIKPVFQNKPENTYAQIKKCFEIIDQQWNGVCDGLIFIPNKQPYWSRDILKWKPVDLLTIDFRVYNVKKNGNKYYCELWVNNKRGESLFNPQPHSEFESELEINNLDILEFQWQSDHFVPTRHRNDKTQPNFVAVAYDIWNDIQTPITKESLLGNDLFLLRKYHNQIKREMIDDIPSGSVVLDLGSGRGGDLKKWKDKECKLVAVDPHIDNNQELLRRAKQMNYPVTLCQCGAEDTATIMKQSSHAKYPIISMFFSLTFFYKSYELLDKLVDTIDEFLLPGGKFIGTTTDGHEVMNLLKGVKYGKWKRGKGFKIIKNYESDTLDLGMQIEVDLEETIVSDQVEYLVDFQLLVDKLKAKNIHLVSSELFSPPGYISNSQKIFSKLNRKFVFKRQ